MYFDDLQSYIAKLQEIGDVDSITAPVDPYLEAAAIIDRICKNPGRRPALLFERMKGSPIPLAANLFGSAKRSAMALGATEIEALASRLRTEIKQVGATHSAQALAALSRRAEIEIVANDQAPCYALDASEAGLDALPALHSWPGDAGRYLTLGQVFSRHPDCDQVNCGMYRLQVLDGHTAAIRCHQGSGGAAHIRAWRAQGRDMPVAVALGGPPVMIWAAATRLPEDCGELEFAAYLAGRPLRLTPCRHDGLLQVPATAEIVIEGHISPGEERLEGPFGNHTGDYVPASAAPVIRVDGVYMRENAIYPCTVVGPPPMENGYMAAAIERLMLPLMQLDLPWVSDLHMPLAGIFHRAALVAMASCSLSLGDISRALWQTALLDNARLIVLLDGEMDLSQAGEVYWRVVNVRNWTEHVLIEHDRLVIDARRSPAAGTVGPDQATLQTVLARWGDYGLR